MSARFIPQRTLSLWLLGLYGTLCALVLAFLPSFLLAVILAGTLFALTIVLALRAAKAAGRRDEFLRLLVDRPDAALDSAEDQRSKTLAEDLRAQSLRLGLLESALTHHPLPCALLGPRNEVVLASQALTGLVGRKTEELVGVTLDSFLPGLPAPGQCGVVAEVQVRVREAELPASSSGAGEARPSRLLLLVPRDQDEQARALFESTRRKYQDTAVTIGELAQRLAESTELMSASADDQAHGAHRLKDQTEAIARSIEAMSGSVMEIAGNAQATNAATDEGREEAQAGEKLVRDAIRGIDHLSEAARELSQVLASLDVQAAEIGRIIGVINDIADQTNLLALNAAIEAARAGDAGRGFAVVADEVRKLAEKTMSATKEVERSIRTIQHSSKEAMASMERTQQQVQESSGQSSQAGDALKRITGRIEDMAQRVGQIAHSAEEQAANTETVNQLVEDVASIARDADESAGQSAQATRDLAQLAHQLLELALALSGRGDSHHAQDESGSKMKGLLPKLLQDFVRETYGDKVYQAMQKAHDDPVFLPTTSYPDTVLHELAKSAAEAAGVSKREVLYKLGFFTPGMFRKIYPRYFKNLKSLKEFYLSMDKLHIRVTKDLPGVRPPHFTFEDKGDRLIMTYHSERGLFDYFEGVLQGSAALLNERARIKVVPLDAETARAEIHFPG